MSYIRTLSNPEGLYIWEDAQDYVAIVWCTEPPYCSSKEDMMTVPVEDFEEACRRWNSTGGLVKVEVNDFSLEYLYPVEGSNIPEEFEYKVKVQYGHMFIILWDVTWNYVTSQVG